MIAVSRRCCPACWKLLGIMDRIDRCGVRGCHPTVHEVELPPWLPRGVMEGMIKDFEDVLRREIFAMMLDKVRRRKGRRPSEQSASATSSGSGHKNKPILPLNRIRAYGVDNINYPTAVDD